MFIKLLCVFAFPFCSPQSQALAQGAGPPPAKSNKTAHDSNINALVIHLDCAPRPRFRRDTANAALLVLDGKIVPNDSLLALNPEVIESINVLKGPAAAAIYGTRANNGALIITRKKKK
ncbi:TonB-dependent receptor plug domain-containing protein [Hymenobacter sp. BT770]|uniref:TonB-dependent receptor plug domain-containing protein n=1 Tax=Hymenobacter sp. BT770 TaxID=2886942 RepID=UPI001D101396|nr:TonB-dependent receptor plug domain-containing protein [Hymenobacter sp. BT770]MCC3153043.1 TonB-dependent receptor plug domain-containing protein [Hymenobacter sp. BT770]MDO3415044.1 TonB-dependent receptor plug domain-containing protein [Hymenobacter sp. BT770]